jgi:hypothetical protein
MTHTGESPRVYGGNTGSARARDTKYFQTLAFASF